MNHRYTDPRGQISLHLPEKLLVDNFAGGGGASTGVEMAFGRPVDIAINHDRDAIAMHAMNHPHTTHYIESVWDVDPVKATQGRAVEWGHFSPDCTHHSKARGGKPRKKEIRGLAWIVIKWAISTELENFSLENVEEFQTWGPLDEEGQPIKERAGETYRAFKAMLTTGIDESHPAVAELREFLPAGTDITKALQGMGYSLDGRELIASDYSTEPGSGVGIATTRKRYIMVGRKDGQPIQWPEKEYGPGLKPVARAADCIDWTIPAPSIFGRKRPLAEKTMQRIAKGLKKFVIESDNPFFISNEKVGYISKHKFMSPGSSLNDPLQTITAGGAAKRPAGSPHSFALTEIQLTPFITEHANASSQRNMRLNEPLRTICAQVKGGHFALVAPVLVKHYGGNYTGAGIDMRRPLDTITCKDHHSLVTAWLLKYYGTNVGTDLHDAMQTITTRDRFALVLVKINGETYQVADIGMRMLQPHELYKAQGFPAWYIHDRTADGKILSKSAQVRMVGNSVPPGMIAAVINANRQAAAKGKNTGAAA